MRTQIFFFSFFLFAFSSLAPPPQINIFLSHANSYATVVELAGNPKHAFELLKELADALIS